MKIRLLICDLDNTLYDWVSYFVPAFYAMVAEAIKITGCDREQLLDDFRVVHRQHRDSEHPFALLETNTIRELFSGLSQKEIAARLDPAFHAFNSTRKDVLHLYPQVKETLKSLSRSGIAIIAHTESKLYGVIDRLTRLELTSFFHKVYCRERSSTRHPEPAAARALMDRFPMDKVQELSHHQQKPNPDVLLEICRDYGVAPSEAAYVGDSMARDMIMARTAGVFSIWAKYGSIHEKGLYEGLVRVTHWTDDDVRRERELSEMARHVVPDFVLQHGFYEIAQVLLSRTQYHLRVS